MVGAYAPNEDSDECVKDDFYDGLQQVNQVILLGDFNANINPMNGAIVGPYGCWKRSTNENGLRLLNLCGHFGLALTSTLNNIKTKDIFTYKDKGPHRLCCHLENAPVHPMPELSSSGDAEILSLCRSPPCQEHTDALGRSTSEEGTKRFQKC